MHQPIAVFDSGLGGLSVVRHLRHVLPSEDIIYFGDTARVPYGTKTKGTVSQFALELARFLLQFEPKMFVVACNTASALALDDLIREIQVPIIGVVEPGARAAVELARGRPIAVIGTEATVGSGSYARAIHAISPRHEVLAHACPLFVPLVEEGRLASDPLVKMAVQTYLQSLRQASVGVVVLGCTHYPLLRDAIVEYLGPTIDVVDSGDATSRAVAAQLSEMGALSGGFHVGSIRCYVSDNPARFQRVGSRFLEEPIESVEFVEPERYVGQAVT